MEKIRDLLDGKTVFSSPESSSHCRDGGGGGHLMSGALGGKGRSLAREEFGGGGRKREGFFFCTLVWVKEERTIAGMLSSGGLQET